MPCVLWTVAQPDAPSLRALHCTRSRLRSESSFTQPTASTISPTSSLRTFEAVETWKSSVRATSCMTLRKSARVLAKARRVRPCGAMRVRASRTCSSCSASPLPMPARRAQRSEMCLSVTSAAPDARLLKKPSTSGARSCLAQSSCRASLRDSLTASTAAQAMTSRAPQTDPTRAFPLRSRALHRSCSLASSTFAWTSPAAAWPSATSVSAWTTSALASSASAFRASSRSRGSWAGVFAAALTDWTFVSACFTASATFRTMPEPTNLLRCLARSFTLSSLPCARCSLPKMARSSLSSRPWVFCSFISTCPMVLFSFPWTAWMRLSSSSGGLASSGQASEDAESCSTSSSVAPRLASSSPSDRSTLIFSS
mmetsp:Transcript_56704/g.166479  ORF Transcript_56704/g.166479 Transcript_56704/m.166479 type:complete len:369 (-) Transcript_56704:156-1262(-)